MTTTIPPLPAGELPERPRGAATWYDVLDVARDADTSTIQQAFERAIHLVDGRNLGGYFMLDPAATAIARQDIEAAWAILSDDDRRSAYDRSLVGDDTDLGSSPSRPRPADLPISLTPRPGLRFLDPVDATPVAGSAVVKGTTPASGNPTVKAHGQMPSQVPGNAAVAMPARLSTPPAHRVGGIPFAPPAETSSPALPPVVIPAVIPEAMQSSTSLPPMTGLPVTLPPTDVTLPPYTLPPTPVTLPPTSTSTPASHGPGVHRRIEVPATATPTPPPGLFTLDGEVNGQTLRRLREARRLSLDELAEATKIRRPYLAAIEEQDIENLPSRVYLRGFLTQIARVLRVDKVRLADGYLAFIARFGK